MQLAFSKARKAKRLQQLAGASANVSGDELAHADHLVSVVRVGDHVDVIAETVEDRKIIGCKRADSAGGLALELR